MTLQQIEKEVELLKSHNNAYEHGLVLLQHLKKYKNQITRKQYSKLNNAIQEERFK